MKHSNNICFFPTQTIFVDDSSDFLNSITLNLNHQMQKYNFFSNVYHAIDYIEKKYEHNIWYKKYLIKLEEEKADRKLIEIDLTGIYRQAFNPHRSDVITTLVIDYDMPEINGIELCERLNHLPIQKILLTGAADEKIAVEAFNSGLINCYIGKHSQNIYEVLNDKIAQASIDYFTNITNLFTECDIQLNKRNLFSYNEFQKFFYSHLENYNIVEFYTLEPEYLYLLIDATGTSNIFGFSSESEITKINEYLLPEIICKLKRQNSSNLIFFPSKIDFLQNTQYSNGFLVDIQTISISDRSYYYFYLQDLNIRN
jgi:CheY-like chemotaxis protein